ncbi:hypothetical protein D3C76_1141270 [compost metagenome]
MELQTKTLSTLFDQLGLASDPASIDAFITEHRLARDMKLSDAPFWSEQQKKFLKDELIEDADWAEVVDELNERLHP